MDDKKTLIDRLVENSSSNASDRVRGSEAVPGGTGDTSPDTKSAADATNDSSYKMTNSRLSTKRPKRKKTAPNLLESQVVNIFGDVPLTDSERRFLIAADNGNVKVMRHCLRENPGLNLNCVDFLGRTPLQLAVQGDFQDAVKFLLSSEQCRMDVTEDAFLHAIKLGSIKLCEVFLTSSLYSDKGKQTRRKLEMQHGFYDQEDSNSDFEPDITPLILAAHCNNCDIVFLLLQKGFTIKTPHNYFCVCTECSNHKKYDRVVHSRSRLNAYKGLASTSYLALASEDPINRAFELSSQLEHLSQKEKEYKNEYTELSEQCKTFAVDLLDLCRTDAEVMAALHGNSDQKDLTRIRQAIKYNQKKFVAHAHTQEHLMEMWYAEVTWLQHVGFSRVILAPLCVMALPIMAIIYFVSPYSRVSRYMRLPIVKFSCHALSYVTFLAFLLVATMTQSFRNPIDKPLENFIVNLYIIAYVIGMIWNEVKQFWEEGPGNYFSDVWNIMDIFMIAFYSASYSIAIVTTLEHREALTTTASEKHRAPLEPSVVANCLFAVANVLSFTRIAYLLPANETFGQLQISYGRMLQDVFKFIIMYTTVLIAFVCGMTSLFSILPNTNYEDQKYIDKFSANIIQTFLNLFWASFGMGARDAPMLPTAIKNNLKVHDSLHLAHLIEVVGHALYALYLMFAVIVLINMLIAMMSNTFEQVRNEEDIEWKFARAELWISYFEQGSTMPIPFNLIPTPKSFAKLFSICNKSACINELANGNEKDESDNRSETTDEERSLKYTKTMRRVVMRYVHSMKFGKKKGSTKDELLELKEDLCLVMNNMHSRMDKKMTDMVDGLIVLEETLDEMRRRIATGKIDESQENLTEGSKLRNLLESKVKEKKEEEEEDESDDGEEWEWGAHRKKKGGVSRIFEDRGEIDDVDFVINPNNPEKTEPLFKKASKKRRKTAVVSMAGLDIVDTERTTTSAETDVEPATSTESVPLSDENDGTLEKDQQQQQHQLKQQEQEQEQEQEEQQQQQQRQQSARTSTISEEGATDSMKLQKLSQSLQLPTQENLDPADEILVDLENASVNENEEAETSETMKTSVFIPEATSVEPDATSSITLDVEITDLTDTQSSLSISQDLPKDIKDNIFYADLV